MTRKIVTGAIYVKAAVPTRKGGTWTVKPGTIGADTAEEAEAFAAAIVASAEAHRARWAERVGATPAPVAPAAPVRARKRPTVAPPVQAPTLVNAEGCPRCGRIGFRTEVGRTWHVERNPDCARYVKRDRYEYAA